MISNPPFGVKIKEKRLHVLKNFDLGHVWESDPLKNFTRTEKVLDSQETRILFAELCI